MFAKKRDLESLIPIGIQKRRPTVLGKSIHSGDTKLWVKGVTYGTFRPDDSGNEFGDRARVDSDLRAISAHGFNSVRVYTTPPLWLLDLAFNYGLYVMVGLPWEQHVTFLDSKDRRQTIRREIRRRVRSCAGHPAVLCYALGNEIPAPIARWYGARRIENFLHDLWADAKDADLEGLFTYVNYPSTEYLILDFADVFCFNVYLENRENLGDYIAHLHTLSGDRPVILTELGLDSRRHGRWKQAEVLDWQVRTAFKEGCSGAFAFSWTDEWHRGGQDIEDWAFGLTDRKRVAKPALETVSRALSQVPFPAGLNWPRISVVVCSYNGERTIRQCLDGLLQLDYPNHEVIVVDDGSTDATAEIAREYPFRLISTENCGLSNARNVGWQAAIGEIVAYIDDDAYPTPEWLKYLAITFMTTNHAAVGGPNLSPPTNSFVANCVALAPGGPVHVLLSDREAEHIPGCNLAIRKSCLRAIDGFDKNFWVAGDDVDICWRLQHNGWTIGFNPAAVVWHQRRNSIHAYWKQQQGYGKAEALLESKWPEKYNSSGHPAWAGRIYAPGFFQSRSRKRRIFHGVWCSSLFQSVYEPSPGLLSSIALMPEWYLVIGMLAVLSVIGLAWYPLLAAVPMLVAATTVTGVNAVLRSVHACRFYRSRSRLVRFSTLATTTFLHSLQPLARLLGRLRHGLSPWRRRGVRGWTLPLPRSYVIWSEQWRIPHEWLGSLEADLRKSGTRVIRGSDFDRWDLEISDGTFGSVRLRSVVEEHGAGKQLIRFRLVPNCSLWTVVLIALPGLLSVSAAWNRAGLAAMILGVLTLTVAVRILGDTGLAMSTSMRVLTTINKNADELDKSSDCARDAAEAGQASAVISLEQTIE